MDRLEERNIFDRVIAINIDWAVIFKLTNLQPIQRSNDIFRYNLILKCHI